MSERQHVLAMLSMSRTVPFAYNHDTRNFRVGNQVLSPNEIPLHGLINTQASEMTPDAIEHWASRTSFLIGRNPISTSVGREAIESIWSQALREETREVMADVLAEQIGGPEVARRAAWLKRGSFGAEKITAGEVFVQVDGICSCLGVDYTVHGSWRDHGFSEYTPHNVENREQRAALLAGLGHIARVANRHVVGRLSVT